MSSPEHSLLWWVIPNVLAGMPMPFIHPERRMNLGGALTDYDDDLLPLHRAGIQGIVSFLEIPSDTAIYESAGFKFLSLPFPDGGVPTLEQAICLVCFVNAQRAGRRPVALHCKEGLGRTGTMMAVYFIWHGHTATEAIAKVRKAEKSAIQTDCQIRFLEEFAARVDGLVALELKKGGEIRK